MAEPPVARHAALLARVRSYYAEALGRHGPTPRGVDWSSEESQRLRFAQLAKLWEGNQAFSLLDYGCGYGALLSYLQEGGAAVVYTGFDVAAEMVATARQLHSAAGARFVSDETELAAVDYVAASGVFNVKLETPEDAWREYVVETLARLAALARRGFAFNLLSLYSDPERRRPDLFYADPLALFDHCKARFAPAVALLHDYPLYEFTILVRTET